MKVTITYGQQKFAPVQFHSFDVGPFSCEIDVPDDGKLQDAKMGQEAKARCQRAYEFLRAQAQEAFKQQLQDFLSRVKEAAAAARAR